MSEEIGITLSIIYFLHFLDFNIKICYIEAIYYFTDCLFKASHKEANSFLNRPIYTVL